MLELDNQTYAFHARKGRLREIKVGRRHENKEVGKLRNKDLQTKEMGVEIQEI